MINVQTFICSRTHLDLLLDVFIQKHLTGEKKGNSCYLSNEHRWILLSANHVQQVYLKVNKITQWNQLTFQLISGDLSSLEPQVFMSHFWLWIEKIKMFTSCLYCFDFMVLGTELTISCRLSKGSTIELHTQPVTFLRHSLFSHENLFLAFVMLIGID